MRVSFVCLSVALATLALSVSIQNSQNGKDLICIEKKKF